MKGLERFLGGRSVDGTEIMEEVKSQEEKIEYDDNNSLDVIVYSEEGIKRFDGRDFGALPVVIGNNVDCDVCLKSSYRAGEIVLNLMTREFEVLRDEVYTGTHARLAKGTRSKVEPDMCIWLGNTPLVFSRSRMKRRQ